MHIVDGALAPVVLVVGGGVALLGCALGLKRMDEAHIPQVGLLSAAFFLASLIHVPIGPSSVHLILNGLVGLVLGWAAFPALLVGLLLQAVFFGFGGLLVLGVNVVNIALPGVVVAALVRPHLAGNNSSKRAFYWGALGGGLAILLTSVMVALSLYLSGDAFLLTAKAVLLAHLPIMLVEGVLTGAAVVLIQRVKPALFTPHFIPVAPVKAVEPKAPPLILAGLLAFALFALQSGMVWAHNMVADLYAEGMQIEGEVGFSGGGAARDVAVSMYDAEGRLLGQTRSDAEGIFRFHAQQVMDYHFRVDAGAGHVVELTLPAEQLSGDGTEATTPASSSLDQEGGGQSTVQSGGEKLAQEGEILPIAAPSMLDAAQLERMIESAVAKQIKPLRKQLLQYENKVRLQDILGGLGYILGLTGLAMGWSRRRGVNPP
ncbi:cobalamin (vitamin B12) biosynthesis CbiM protein [Magnetococcus marinus MC-1]|uniref:Cobalamin (Vitamin B12) biosynthesis CbiM protein n=1 Tax=Magnetococcus marinus (strain ATCC BAA-1437 / JCM 17883 / MC-1) TaxID=156889 RepID=A0LCD7_MAGMM|nr:cobalt transporter CbiM [Magnetococcus marinus]ABK45630.1 cobalamin (vitamin B12) biosynthesis CbiM protein [Magnetococcus marinus MC-1]